MCFKRFLAHENKCLDIKISQIRQLIAEIYDKLCFQWKKSKWPPSIQDGRQKNANHIFSITWHPNYIKKSVSENVPKNSTNSKNNT